jgi:hypothetical protein
VEQKSLLFLYSPLPPLRDSLQEVPSQMAARLRTGNPL